MEYNLRKPKRKKKVISMKCISTLATCLKQWSPLSLLVSTNFEVLAPLDRVLGHMLATLALKSQNNLLSSLRLLVEDRLGLSTITRLFPIIPALSLSCKTILPLFVLCYLMQSVLLALLAFTVRLLCLRNVHHFCFFLMVSFLVLDCREWTSVGWCWEYIRGVLGEW